MACTVGGSGADAAPGSDEIETSREALCLGCDGADGALATIGTGVGFTGLEAGLCN